MRFPTLASAIVAVCLALADRPLQPAMALSVVLALSLALPAPALAQTFEDGLAAAQRGDPAAAIAIWAPLAEAGHAEAQHWLAESFWGGWWGGAENLEQRAHWHMRAAEQGHVPSFVMLGHMHALGYHLAQDDARAAEWFRRAADSGDADGQYYLGHHYYEGRSVPRDFGEAYGLWQLAIAQGHQGARAAMCAEISDFCED